MPNPTTYEGGDVSVIDSADWLIRTRLHAGGISTTTDTSTPRVAVISGDEHTLHVVWRRLAPAPATTSATSPDRLRGIDQVIFGPSSTY